MIAQQLNNKPSVFTNYTDEVRKFSELLDIGGVVRIRLDRLDGRFIELNFNTNRFICGNVDRSDIMYHGTFTYIMKPINAFTLYYLNTVDESHTLTPLSKPFQFTSTFIMSNTNMKKYKLHKNKVVPIERCGFGLKFNNPITPEYNIKSNKSTYRNDIKQFYLFWGGL